MATLAELFADPGPPDDPYCTACHGFGFVKELPNGMRADMGWLMCSYGCGARQRRTPADVLAYNDAWTRERKHLKP